MPIFAHKLLKEEVITVSNSVATVKSLVAGAALQRGVTRLTLHNLDEEVDLEVLMAASAPTSGSMDVLKPDGAKTYEQQLEQLEKIYVHAASSIKVCVIQEGGV